MRERMDRERYEAALNFKAGCKRACRVLDGEAVPISVAQRMLAHDAYLIGYDEIMSERTREPDVIVDRDPGDEA